MSCNCHDPTLILGSDTDTVAVEKPVVTDDYSALRNKPSIEGVALEGDRTFEDLGLYESVYSKRDVDESMAETRRAAQDAADAAEALGREVQSIGEPEEISNVELDALLTLDD